MPKIKYGKHMMIDALLLTILAFLLFGLLCIVIDGFEDSDKERERIDDCYQQTELEKKVRFILAGKSEWELIEYIDNDRSSHIRCLIYGRGDDRIGISCHGYLDTVDVRSKGVFVGGFKSKEVRLMIYGIVDKQVNDKRNEIIGSI